jgi:uncharacterized membrane protein
MMKKTLVIVCILVAILLVVTIYQVLNISGTNDPIKEYVSKDNTSHAVKKLQANFANNSSTSFIINDTLTNQTNNYLAYELTIILKTGQDSLSYYLKCESVSTHNSNSKILLVGAHDLRKNIGGYNSNASGMKVLLNNFNSYLLPILKKSGIIEEPK